MKINYGRLVVMTFPVSFIIIATIQFHLFGVKNAGDAAGNVVASALFGLIIFAIAKMLHVFFSYIAQDIKVAKPKKNIKRSAGK